MFNVRINGSIYNLEKMSSFELEEDDKLLIFDDTTGGATFIEYGPEAVAFWEWLQSTVVWKMPVSAIEEQSE